MFLPDVTVLVAAFLGWSALHQTLAQVVRRCELGKTESGYHDHDKGLVSSTYERHVLLFDAAQRALNMVVQCAHLAFNVFVMFFDVETRRDPLRAYSNLSHCGFVALTAFFLYDTVLWLVHPRVRNRAGWLLHHIITIVLLIMNFSIRKGAFAASCLLVSSAGHILNEVRWFRCKLGKPSSDFINVLNNIVIFWSCMAAPVYMIHVIALSTRTPWNDLFFSVMRWQCLAGLITIYTPHVALFFVQLQRTRREWRTENADIKRL